MESEVSTVAQVELFEDYCLRKRSLEADMELALTRRDEKAVEAIVLAELELENTKHECANINVRVKAALEGNLERTGKSGLPSEIRNNDLRISIEAGAISFASKSGNTHKRSASLDRKKLFRPSDRFEDDSNNEFLTLLVQRYTDICRERQMLQEEIEDRLERKERMAAEKLRCAKITLETTRQKAIDVVAALSEASCGDTKINLPAGATNSLGSKAVPIDAGSISGPGPKPTMSSPQQNVPYRPPLLRDPSGADRPHPPNPSPRPSNNGGVLGPPGTWREVHGSPHVAPHPKSQRPMLPPPSVPGIPNRFPIGAAICAPHVPGQAPQRVPGQGPNGVGTQGMPAPIMHGTGQYPFVSSISNIPVLYSPSLTVPRLPLRPHHASTVLECTAPASQIVTTSSDSALSIIWFSPSLSLPQQSCLVINLSSTTPPIPMNPSIHIPDITSGHY